MLPLTVCPATCELCGNWLPEHQTSCPRNGVHPSQWSHSPDMTEQHEYLLTMDDDDNNSFAGQFLLLSQEEEHDDNL